MVGGRLCVWQRCECMHVNCKNSDTVLLVRAKCALLSNLGLRWTNFGLSFAQLVGLIFIILKKSKSEGCHRDCKWFARPVCTFCLSKLQSCFSNSTSHRDYWWLFRLSTVVPSKKWKNSRSKEDFGGWRCDRPQF